MKIRPMFLALAAMLAAGAAAFADELVLKHDSFKRNLHGWGIPSYWSGKLELADDGGRKVLRLAGRTGKKGAFGRATAISLLSSMAIQLDNGCIMHMPEILDGDWPHKPRGCDAQAWGLSEYYRVWKLLHPASKSTGKDHE